MIKFEISEVDKDYGSLVSNEYKFFGSLEEAEKWCVDNSWSGYHYTATEVNAGETK